MSPCPFCQVGVSRACLCTRNDDVEIPPSSADSFLIPLVLFSRTPELKIWGRGGNIAKASEQTCMKGEITTGGSGGGDEWKVDKVVVRACVCVCVCSVCACFFFVCVHIVLCLPCVRERVCLSCMFNFIAYVHAGIEAFVHSSKVSEPMFFVFQEKDSPPGTPS